MSKHIQEQLDIGKACIVAAPAVQNAEKIQVEVNRTFEMPAALYGTTVACYLGFLGITFAGFKSPGLVIPMLIFAAFIIAGFGVPAIWARMKPDSASRPMTMGLFKRAGIMTNTGHLSSSEATVQMLILPVLIVLWGLAVVTIAALV